jgi:hypothetical protein
MRETLEDIRKRLTPRMVIPPHMREDIAVLRRVIMENINNLDPWSLDDLAGEKVSEEQRKWARDLRAKWQLANIKDAVDASASESSPGGYTDEPPF